MLESATDSTDSRGAGGWRDDIAFDHRSRPVVTGRALISGLKSFQLMKLGTIKAAATRTVTNPPTPISTLRKTYSPHPQTRSSVPANRDQASQS